METLSVRIQLYITEAILVILSRNRFHTNKWMPTSSLEGVEKQVQGRRATQNWPDLERAALPCKGSWEMKKWEWQLVPEKCTVHPGSGS